MPEYLSPGVYIEELNVGPVPIEGVSTSTTGFVGQTERGPTVPMLVTSFAEYQRLYGGLIDPGISYLPFATKGYFENGGKRVFIARVVGSGAKEASIALDALKIVATAIGEGAWGNRIYVRIKPSTLERRSPTDPSKTIPVGFRLTFLYFATPPPTPLVDPFDRKELQNPNRREPDVVEDYDNLRADSSSPEYAVSTVNSSSQLVQLMANGDVTLSTVATEFSAGQFKDGADGAAATPVEYLGSDSDAIPPDKRTGLAGLDTVDDISILCIPDQAKDESFITVLTPEIVNQCERRKDRFAILQFKKGEGNVSELRPDLDSSFGAVYLPWIRVFNPLNNDYPLIPAGGHIAGIYANTDITRGVHKAPANDREIQGIIVRDLDSTRKPLEFTFSKGQQDMLNPRGVNVIRDFRNHGRGIRLWGARTMSSDGRWKYINVRRLFIFVEQSIDRGIQWVVFEPNNPTTWAAVRRSITDFLRTIWLNDALMGLTEEEAFQVKVDRTTMTQDDIDNGRLICYVSIAPVKPAEFVIIRISQKTIESTQ